MEECACTTTQRCAEAHALRDAYREAPTLADRLAATATYTAHLHQAHLLRPTQTAIPTWTCADACAPTAPCRAFRLHP